MRSDVREIRLGEVANFGYGKFLAKKTLNDSGYPVFSGYSVVGYLPKFQFAVPQIVVVCRGIGGTGDVKMSPPLCTITNLSIVISEDSKVLDKSYLFWALKSVGLHSLRTGSAQPQITIGDLQRFPLTIPTSLTEQRQIAALLDAFEKRTASLELAGQTLEAIAHTIFKSWFVDFDPVRAKAEGLEPEGMDASIAALFPSELVLCKGRAIPREWQVQRISELMVLSYGKSLPSRDRIAGTVPVYGSGGITGWHNACLVRQATIIIGRKGSVGTIYREDRPSFPIDTAFYVQSKGVSLGFCFQVLSTLDLHDMNTDAAVPGLNRENVYRLDVAVPPSSMLERWDSVESSLHERTALIQRQLETLTSLRDALLPRLISGKLRIPDAEKLVASAL